MIQEHLWHVAKFKLVPPCILPATTYLGNHYTNIETISLVEINIINIIRTYIVLYLVHSTFHCM